MRYIKLTVSLSVFECKFSIVLYSIVNMTIIAVQ